MPLAQRLLQRLPRRTVRMRLTMVYGTLFLLSGAALLAITYGLVVNATQNVVFRGQDSIFTIFAPANGPPEQGGQMISGAGSPGSGPALSVAPTPAQEAQMREVLARQQRQHDAELEQLLIQSGMALAGMAILSIVLGWIVAGRVLRPLRTITRTVHDISATNLHERLALGGPHDELKQLGDTFDSLLGRLEASFQSQRQFIANASHELRTPLARQRTLVQVALSDPDATVESLRAAHERVLIANRQQERLIEALLTLARGEAGLDQREPFDLAWVSDHVLLAHDSEATRRGLHLSTTLDPAPTTGDPHLIERLVTNLVDNALRHNTVSTHHPTAPPSSTHHPTAPHSSTHHPTAPPSSTHHPTAPPNGGWVHLATGTSDGQATLSVTNTGPVIDVPDVGRLFQPFQRLGADRTRHDGGLGLGLSIVQAIVTAHGGTLAAVPRPEGGLHVSVTFPVSAAPSPDDEVPDARAAIGQRAGARG